VNHPNIVRAVDIFDTSSRIAIVMQLYEGGTLLDVMQAATPAALPESHAAQCIRDILRGLRYLHRMKIVHRDLKPGNILCRSSTPPYSCVIADFGMSCFLDRELRHYSAVGTVPYMPPEMLASDPDKFGTSVDVWSTGVILFNLLTGCYPFSGDGDADTKRRILESDVWQLELDHMSPAAGDLLRRLLDRNPASRLGVDEALEHPFLKEAAAAKAER